MAFDPEASCVTEEVFGLPVCSQGDPDTLKLHAAILKFTTWLEGHYLQRDPYDVPYVYRTNYLPDFISGNDVAALGRITEQASARGVDIPTILGPMLPPDSNTVATAEDVTYVAAYAGAIADALDPLLAATMAATPAPRHHRWWLIGGVVAGTVLLGIAFAGSYSQRVA